MPDNTTEKARTTLMILLLCWATIPLTGCQLLGTLGPTGTGTGLLPGAPTGGIGTLSGNPGAPTGSIGTLSGNPGAPTNSTGTLTASVPPATGTDPFTAGTDNNVSLSGTDSSVNGNPGGAAAPTSMRVDLRTGGQNMESGAYSWAAGAVQPSTNDPTVLRHEAVHFINGELGGNPSWQNLGPNVFRAFYIWGTNQYYVVPNTGVRKSHVEALVPTHLTSSHDNYFRNFDFASRDGLHLFEDFSAEIGSGEKSALLFDMLVFSAALGLKLEQQNSGGGNDYWGRDGGAIFRGTFRAFSERASPGLEGRLQALARDSSAKSTALRSFLKRTYGEAWTRQVLGF